MDKYIENTVVYNGITFCLTDKPSVDEREIHSYHEVLLYIGGETELITAEGQRRLKEASVIIIPRETYHFLRFKEGTFFSRLKISFSAFDEADTPIGRMLKALKVCDELSDSARFVFDRLCRILTDRGDGTGFYAYSAFLMLMTELDLSDTNCPEGKNTKKSIMSEVMDYISEDLSADASVRALSERFHISPSGITHLFKKEFGISLHKFVLQKRLITAKRLLIEGEQLSKIYAELGFSDYSSLYKAYVKFFGYPPSRDKNAHL